jgi:hypothetical protein
MVTVHVIRTIPGARLNATSLCSCGWTTGEVHGQTADVAAAVHRLATRPPWEIRSVECKTCADNRAWGVYWHRRPGYEGTRQHMGSFPTHTAALSAVSILAACDRDGGIVPCMGCRGPLGDLALR